MQRQFDCFKRVYMRASGAELWRPTGKIEARYFHSGALRQTERRTHNVGIQFSFGGKVTGHFATNVYRWRDKASQVALKEWITFFDNHDPLDVCRQLLNLFGWRWVDADMQVRWLEVQFLQVFQKVIAGYPYM